MGTKGGNCFFVEMRKVISPNNICIENMRNDKGMNNNSITLRQLFVLTEGTFQMRKIAYDLLTFLEFLQRT